MVWYGSTLSHVIVAQSLHQNLDINLGDVTTTDHVRSIANKRDGEPREKKMMDSSIKRSNRIVISPKETNQHHIT